MGEWSQLPKELLHSISQRLDSTLSLICFRSVCSSWHSSTTSSSIPYIHNNLQLPFFPNNDGSKNDNTSTLSLSWSTLILINPSQQQQQRRPWLIKIGTDESGKTQLLHPLYYRFHLIHPPRFPSRFLNVTELCQLPFIHLGQEFLLKEIPPRSINSPDMAKVVFSWLGSNQESFVLFAIHYIYPNKIAMFRDGDKDWTIILDMPRSFRDVHVFKGKLFAIDYNGRTVTVGLDLTVTVVADLVLGGDKKFLVECEDELFLVDQYWVLEEIDPEYENVDAYTENREQILVNYKVYRLDEEEKRWVELGSLGDKVFFLGYDCSFYASASDLCVAKGNCVIYRHGTGMSVFHLEDGFLPWSDCRDYFNLFWPPPNWITFR